MSLSRRDLLLNFAIFAGLSPLYGFANTRSHKFSIDPLSFRANKTTRFIGKKTNLKIKGNVPKEISGSYFKNGPGIKEKFGQKLNHYFDGDSLVYKFNFENGNVDFEAKFIQTPQRRDEVREQRMIYDEFGTASPSRRLQDRFNQPNISLLKWQNDFYAFSEGGHPVLIDKNSLSYIKTTSFNGGLGRNISFIAHPKIDPKTGDLYGIGIHQGLSMAVKVFRVDALTKKAYELYSFPQRRVPLIHDFVITEDKIIIVIPSAHFSVFDLARGVRPLSNALHYYENRPTRVMVLGKYETKVYREAALDSSLVFHHGPAYEQDGKLILNTCMADDGGILDLIADFRYQNEFASDRSLPDLKQIVVDFKSGNVISQKTILKNHDFPTSSPLKDGEEVNYLYAVKMGDKKDPMAFRGLSKINLKTKLTKSLELKAHQVSSEASYIPHPQKTAEDSGWLVFLQYDDLLDETSLEILTASDLKRVASVEINEFVPLGFHGHFDRS